MGGIIVIYVDGTNGYFLEVHVVCLHLQEHIGLVFVAIPLNLKHQWQVLSADGAQTGLGIGYLDAAGETKDASGQYIAEFASGRNVVTGEISGS